MPPILRQAIDIIRNRTAKKPREPKPPPLSGGTIFNRNPHILSVDFKGGESVLFDLERRTSILINETASAVYTATDGELDVDGISRIIGEMYGEEFEPVFKDVKRIYAEFFKKGVVINGRR
ncbi:MAG: PqqD family protein [Deltaproteobacteria bacterium]|uniref:PqqD family protein n=1 Tax=Candidatus Zymogenus saltonus TaxID=2844893 RepID=A0A9D8KEC3_9DELT|nr:PqqD family protein [Candidatus Zymogenus saltonus]